MTIELKKEIESELRKIYAAFGFIDVTAIDRKVNGQFRMLAVTQPKMVTLDNGREMIGKPLFIAVDDNDTPTMIHRDGEVYSKRKETWLVLFVTEAHAWLMIETLDHLHHLRTITNDILENGVWKCVNVDDAVNMGRNWLVLY